MVDGGHPGLVETLRQIATPKVTPIWRKMQDGVSRAPSLPTDFSAWIWCLIYTVYPVRGRVPGADELSNAISGHIFQGFFHAPFLPHGLFDGGCGNTQVAQKAFMRPPLSVRRLAGWMRQERRNQLEIKVQQNHTVKEDEPLLPPLRVARELQGIDRQVRMPPDFNTSPCNHVNSTAEAVHDMDVGSLDRRERTTRAGPKYERVVQAPGTLNNRPSSAVPSEDGNACSPTRFGINFRTHPVGVAEHDEDRGGFPEPEYLPVVSLLAHLEQSIITGKVFFGRRIGKIQ